MNLFKKYIGIIQYKVTIINVNHHVQVHQFKSIKEVDEFVNEVNKDTYWMVQKIEKSRKLNFSYKKKVSHIPLHLHTNICETYNIDGHEYSFFKKDSSLKNIKREIRHKSTREEKLKRILNG